MKIFTIIIFVLYPWLNSQAQEEDAYGYFHAGKFDQSLSAFNLLIEGEMTPRSSDLLKRGIAYYRLGNFPAALKDLKHAAEKEETEALLWLARLHSVTGDTHAALTFLSEYVKKSNGLDFHLVRKDSLFRSYHGSDQWFNIWQDENLTEEARVIDQARKFSIAGKREDAILLLQSSNLNTPAVRTASSELYAEKGEIQFAVNELNKGLGMNPGNSALLKQKSKYLLKLGDSRTAFGILSQLVQSDPSDFSLHLLVANAALQSGILDAAQQHIQIYLKYTDEEEAVLIAGKIDLEAGNYMNSIRYFNRLLERDSSNATYFKARGMAYYQTNTFSQAAYDLSMSLDLVPYDGESNYYLGLTQSKLGNKKAACYYMNRAKKYGDKRAHIYLIENCGN